MPEEKHIEDTSRDVIIKQINTKIAELQLFLELRWINCPWELHPDKKILDDLEDIKVMVCKIEHPDAEVPRDPVNGQSHDPKQDHNYSYSNWNSF